MIKRINVQNFGCFSDFNWNTALRNTEGVQEFQRLNILYGRNYSGKTTLSRIFRSFEVAGLPENYNNPEFEITSDSETISHRDVDSHTLDIRVYNRDFIDENLGFLHDNSEGEVTTFAILGKENKLIEEQISQKEAELGDVDRQAGARYQYDQAEKAYNKSEQNFNTATEELKSKLRRFANDTIKPNRSFGNPNYNINSINSDIRTIRQTSYMILSEEEERQNKELLLESALPDILERISFQPNFTELHRNTVTVLEKKIEPTIPISDLLDEPSLQNWVRKGIEYHRNIRTTCGFCGQVLPFDIWNKLDGHFNKESSELERDISLLEKEIRAEIENASNSKTLPERHRFYARYRTSFEEARNESTTGLDSYVAEASKLLEQAEARKANLFDPMECPSVENLSVRLSDSIGSLTDVIEENNEFTETLSTQQQDARKALRLNAVAKFIKDIDLDAEELKVKRLKEEVSECATNLDFIHKNVLSLETEIETLRISLQDEKKGADKVNEYLEHFFGHKGLRLVALEDPQEFKFQIKRGENIAYNMSEGECSLVAFCYFMARLEDVETKGKDLIVYIDDPVSSLDSNHVFFVYSLINAVLAQPETISDGSIRLKYKQLFVSTHSLEFLKYLKRLTKPTGGLGKTGYFIVETEGSNCGIRMMPKYLKNYQTEFIYLFHQIYKCSDAYSLDENQEAYYNFGNNLRKFLDAYLFYWYPDTQGQQNTSERLRLFLGDDAIATSLINRFMNELSHLEEIVDRGMQPIDIPEINTLANFVLDKMFAKDSDQYNALLASIGEPPRNENGSSTS